MAENALEVGIDDPMYLIDQPIINLKRTKKQNPEESFAKKAKDNLRRLLIYKITASFLTSANRGSCRVGSTCKH